MAFATFCLDTATVSLAFSTIVTPKRTVRLWKGGAAEEEALLLCLVTVHPSFSLCWGDEPAPQRKEKRKMQANQSSPCTSPSITPPHTTGISDKSDSP